MALSTDLSATVDTCKALCWKFSEILQHLSHVCTVLMSSHEVDLQPDCYSCCRIVYFSQNDENILP